MPGRNNGSVKGVHGGRTEDKDVDAAAGVMVSEAHASLDFIDEVMAAEGLSPRTAEAIRKRLRDRYPETREAIRKHATKDFIDQLSTLRKRLIDSIDDETIAKASLAQRMVAYGIATDKELLIGGKPTQIISVEQRRKLADLAPALVKEMMKRGVDLKKQDDGSYSIDD
jgi:uncharacterized membrane protein